MRIKRWDTRRSPDPGLRRDWRAPLPRCPHANVALDPCRLAWEARHGRAAPAVRVARAERVPEVPAATFEPGEGWREWDRVAVGHGAVGAGSGYGVMRGGAAEYRANGPSSGAHGRLPAIARALRPCKEGGGS